MKISFISTIYNEGATIENFLNSILNQSKKPDEIIIVDGGSTDQTIPLMKNVMKKFIKNKITFTYLIKKGNRSVGRNEAIKHATGEIIVCSDAGNVLDKNWVKNITEPFKDKKVGVVAGYYEGLAENVFQKCLIPYVLVMPDKTDPNNFLPATRSVAFTKAIWEKVGGFDERLSHNEDYAFAKALQKVKAKIVFKKNATVYWIPRTTFRQTFIMFFRFAYGDAEARILRPKVMFLFARYVVVICLVLLAIVIKSPTLFLVLLILFLLYLYWAVAKNYRYVNQWQGIFILPALQLVADWAVLKGTLLGSFRRGIRYN